MATFDCGPVTILHTIYLRSFERLQFWSPDVGIWTLLIGRNTVLRLGRLVPGNSNRNMGPLRLGLLVIYSIVKEENGQYQCNMTHMLEITVFCSLAVLYSIYGHRKLASIKILIWGTFVVVAT